MEEQIENSVSDLTRIIAVNDEISNRFTILEKKVIELESRRSCNCDVSSEKSDQKPEEELELEQLDQDDVKTQEEEPLEVEVEKEEEPLEAEVEKEEEPLEPEFEKVEEPLEAEVENEEGILEDGDSYRPEETPDDEELQGFTYFSEESLNNDCNCELCNCAELPLESDEEKVKENARIAGDADEDPITEDVLTLLPLQGEDDSDDGAEGEVEDEDEAVDESDKEETSRRGQQQEMGVSNDEESYSRSPRENLSYQMEQLNIILQKHSGSELLAKLNLLSAMENRLANLEETIVDKSALQELSDKIQNFEGVKSEIMVLKKQGEELYDVKKTLSTKVDIDEMASKADREEVSCAVDGLTSTIHETIQEINTQAIEMEKRHEEAGVKMKQFVNKGMSAMNDAVSNKMDKYNKKLTQLALKQAELSSIGAIGRSQLLRNQNCVACGSSIVMRCEGGYRAPIRALPPRGLRMRHVDYASWPADDDAVHLSSTQSKDSNLIQACLSTRIGVQGKRHCGGRHTITTAPQRVVRFGQPDFLNNPIFDNANQYENTFI